MQLFLYVPAVYRTAPLRITVQYATPHKPEVYIADCGRCLTLTQRLAIVGS